MYHIWSNRIINDYILFEVNKTILHDTYVYKTWQITSFSKKFRS